MADHNTQSEASCPFSGGALQTRTGRRRKQCRLVAQPAQPQDPSPELIAVRSHGPGVQLCRGVQDPGPACRRQGPPCADDGLAGLVARGLRPLRPVFHPHGLAQRGHVPHRRRPRRRGFRDAALRAAEQLARQRKSRQGAPPVMADQAEVRPENLLGRPDGPGRHRGHGIDGIEDLWFCRRASRRLGAGRDLLGTWSPNGWATSVTPAIANSKTPGRGPDGPDLREPRRPERQAGPAGLGTRHPRDLRPHGHERRGDRGADRRRAHLRQTAWRGQSGRACRPRARGRRHRGPGLRLDQQVRRRPRRAHHHQRHRRGLDQERPPSGTTAISRTCSATSGS